MAWRRRRRSTAAVAQDDAAATASKPAANNAHVMLVLSQDYAEDIVARHRSWRSGGGRFIIPLPEIMVV